MLSTAGAGAGTIVVPAIGAALIGVAVAAGGTAGGIAAAGTAGGAIGKMVAA